MKSKWLAILVATMMTLSLAVGVAVANPGQGQGPPDHAQNNNRGGAGEDCPAAPAVAAKLLSEAGVNHRYGEGPDGGNYVSDVAREMGPGTDFDGVEKCDEDAYREAVAEFLVEQGADVEAPEPIVEEGEVWNKTQNEYYETIQGAIDEAEAEDKILVGSGEYEENVVIDGDEKDLDGLILKGYSEEDRPVIDSKDHGIRIMDVEDVTLKNFTVDGAEGRGVYATRTDGITIDNVLTKNNENDGIRVRESEDATVQNSMSIDNNGDGITFYAYGSVLNNEVGNNVERGIYHNGKSADSGTGHVIISGNEVYGNQLEHTWIDHHAAGIEVYAGRDGKHTLSAEVENNIVYDNKANGILLYKVNHETGVGMVDSENKSIVKGNEVSNTVNLEGKTPVGDGILIYKSHYVTVEDNVVDNNEHAGVRVTVDYHYDYSDEFPIEGNEVVDNIITNNYYGVLIEAGAEETLVEDNTYEGNEENEKRD
ncbi:DUF1565 domain-containing protein [Methanosalsum natronophilum]|uniref:DUF1565 domain-containing protein n=1 Tax=Methanosalsum natronophilum TaxID=768733 RepID=A0A424YWQ3_9EURY|nr:MAG: DUF1565 domain-containing protein [Methanosalsum natronophilum]